MKSNARAVAAKAGRQRALNKAHPANPAMTSLFHAGCQWRGVADAPRYCPSPEALWTLAQIRPDPQTAIPVLVAGLDDPSKVARLRAAWALGKYGPDARAAVPALLRMLATNRGAAAGQPRLDLAASAALKAIDPEAAAQAGVK